MQTTTQTNIERAFTRESNSTVFTRIDGPLRREINIAIIERRPATIKDVHEKFKLQALGVGYHAFYRYARRIRAEAALIETAAALPDPENNVPRMLTRALAQRLIESLAFEKPGPRQIQRLADAYRASVTSLALIQRHYLLPTPRKSDDAKLPDPIDDLAAIVREFKELVQHEETIGTTEPQPDTTATRATAARARIPSRTHAPRESLPAKPTTPSTPRTRNARTPASRKKKPPHHCGGSKVAFTGSLKSRCQSRHEDESSFLHQRSLSPCA